jgi:hypothetical protein
VSGEPGRRPRESKQGVDRRAEKAKGTLHRKWRQVNSYTTLGTKSYAGISSFCVFQLYFDPLLATKATQPLQKRNENNLLKPFHTD